MEAEADWERERERERERTLYDKKKIINKNEVPLESWKGEREREESEEEAWDKKNN